MASISFSIRFIKTNLFTRCFRKQFRKERIHLLGMRCHGKSEGKVKLAFIQEMQHAEFPGCLRFSFTRNKLEKSRKPSSSACAYLSHDWNRSRGNPCQS